MSWITTKTGNRILIGENESIESAVKEYYQSLVIKPMKMSSREEAYVKRNIRQSGKRFIGENISIINLPPNEDSNSYNLYIFTHSGGKIENARITIVDSINHDEFEYLEDDWKIRRYWYERKNKIRKYGHG